MLLESSVAHYEPQKISLSWRDEHTYILCWNAALWRRHDHDRSAWANHQCMSYARIFCDSHISFFFFAHLGIINLSIKPTIERLSHIFHDSSISREPHYFLGEKHATAWAIFFPTHTLFTRVKWCKAESYMPKGPKPTPTHKWGKWGWNSGIWAIRKSWDRGYLLCAEKG